MVVSLVSLPVMWLGSLNKENRRVWAVFSNEKYEFGIPWVCPPPRMPVANKGFAWLEISGPKQVTGILGHDCILGHMQSTHQISNKNPWKLVAVPTPLAGQTPWNQPLLELCLGAPRGVKYCTYNLCIGRGRRRWRRVSIVFWGFGWVGLGKASLLVAIVQRIFVKWTMRPTVY